MKHFFSFALAAVLVLTLGSFALAQQTGPPPPPVPDYSPANWQEYSFAEDNVRFKFPVKPERKDLKDEESKSIIHKYSRQSFMLFELNVHIFPADLFGSEKETLAGVVQNLEAGILKFEPKLFERKDILVDEHPGKFIQFEANTGKIMRFQVIVVKNTVYSALVVSKKGDRHGINWENDFELQAMAFLDSIRLIETK